MAWDPDAEVDIFGLCLFKRSAEVDRRAQLEYINTFEKSVRSYGGNIQLRSDYPQSWDIIDGKDQHVEPNHLNPAIFDVNSVMIIAFPSRDEMTMWWDSDLVFELLKFRQPIEKMGIFIFEGLAQSWDIGDSRKVAFGDKICLLEFHKMLSFKHMQQYVDDYKRFAERAPKEIGMPCNLLFSEGVSGVLANEFPLEAACASTWRIKTDVHLWYDTEMYQESLYPVRNEFARTLTLMLPLHEERLEDLNAARKKNRSKELADNSKFGGAVGLMALKSQ